jgi:hypothetical protein
MGRPAKGAMSSFPEEISTTLLRWREEHPGWGPVTLHKEMEQHPAFAGQRVPGPASIGRFLQAKGLTKRYEPHQELPKEEKPAGLPHELWEMDAQGYQFIPDVGQMNSQKLWDSSQKLRDPTIPFWGIMPKYPRSFSSLHYLMIMLPVIR